MSERGEDVCTMTLFGALVFYTIGATKFFRIVTWLRAEVYQMMIRFGTWVFWGQLFICNFQVMHNTSH